MKESKIYFYSEKNKNNAVTLKTAIINGFDRKTGRLYIPSRIPKFDATIIYRNPPPPLRDTALEIIKEFFSGTIPEEDIISIVAQFYPHKVPVTPLAQTTYLLELFHGPTCNFKDIGAGFLAHTLEFFSKKEDKPFTLLLATTGEGGCAVGNAVKDIKGVNAVIIFPKNTLSEIQEKQISKFSKNVKAVAVEGSFEDCKNITLQALTDDYLTNKYNLVPADTVNFATVLPQTAYYVYAVLNILNRCGYDNRIENPHIITSIPSGSLGNLTAGLLAKKMGAPIKGFIAAGNANRTACKWLSLGEYKEIPLKKTNTPALDYSAPINAERIESLYSKSEILETVASYWTDDKGTIEAIRKCNDRTGYIIDPHGAIAWQAWMDIYNKKLQPQLDTENTNCLPGVQADSPAVKKWLSEDSSKNLIGLVLQTAHPAKFPEIVTPAAGKPPSLPFELDKLHYEELIPAETIEASFTAFKNWITAELN